MATLQGGVYITFAKPYLEMVAQKIRNDEPFKLADLRRRQKINKTNDIKKFLRDVKNEDENGVASVLKTGSQYSTIFNGYKWTEIDKGQFTGKGSVAAPSTDAEDTAMQERASLFAIQKSIENNGYSNQKKFYQLYRKDMKKIYPGMDELWEDTFFQQQVTVHNEVGNTKYRHYSRDDGPNGMMKYITDIVRNNYGISKKDTWNPADIWLVSNYRTVVKELEKRVKDDITPLQEFNEILREMFHDRKIVGISLKKMSGKTALWENVNLDNMDIFDSDEYRFHLDSTEIDFGLKNKTEFKNSDSKIFISGKKGEIKFQIRQNSAGFNNLKIEGTDLGATAARLGKVPLNMAATVLKSEGITFDNDNKNYPKSSQEFKNEKAKFVAQWKKVKQYTGVNTEQQFVKNVSAAFDGKRSDYAHSKLMQLDLLSKLASKSIEKQELILTSLAYLAQKKGQVFGPFGKLY